MGINAAKEARIYFLLVVRRGQFFRHRCDSRQLEQLAELTYLGLTNRPVAIWRPMAPAAVLNDPVDKMS